MASQWLFDWFTDVLAFSFSGNLIFTISSTFQIAGFQYQVLSRYQASVYVFVNNQWKVKMHWSKWMVLFRWTIVWAQLSHFWLSWDLNLGLQFERLALYPLFLGHTLNNSFNVWLYVRYKKAYLTFPCIII